MELRIISPQEGGFIKEIQWNKEELKAWVAEKVKDYRGLVFTEATIPDAKKDRADLNKLKKAFEDERKRIKKLCLEPYEDFERQEKELIALIDEPLQLIDCQIKEVEEKRKEEKRLRINDLFSAIGFQAFVSLDMIWDEKWLNATVSMSKIEEQMKSRMYQIGEDVFTIQNLPEFSFEAMEVYKKSLDLTKAIQEGQRLSEIQKRKAAYEEEQRKKEEAAKQAAIQPVNKPEPDQSEVKEENVELLQLDFRVWGTREQIMGLRQYLTDNKIKFGKVE